MLPRDEARPTGGRKRIRWYLTAAAVFLALRLIVAYATYVLTDGNEFSSDCRFYLYLADHPWAVLTGENLRDPDHDKAVLTNYGPLMGMILGAPLAALRKVLPDFLAVRVFFIAFEGLALLWAGGVVARLRDIPKRGLAFGAHAEYLFLAALLPLGWPSTAAWAQDEIFLAPFLFAGFVYAYRDRPWASALSLCAGALVAKYFALAFLPAAWLLCRRRRSFLAASVAGIAPLVAYAAYIRWAYGVIPLLGYDTASALPFTLSAFTLYDFAREWLGLAAADVWITPVSKLLFLGAATATFVFFYKPAAPLSLTRATRVWVAFACSLLLFNVMGQPEYLSWFAFFAPLALVAFPLRRTLLWGAGGIVILSGAAWVWNSSAALNRWSVIPGGGAWGELARTAATTPGFGALEAVEIGAALVYLILLAACGTAAFGTGTRKPSLKSPAPVLVIGTGGPDTPPRPTAFYG